MNQYRLSDLLVSYVTQAMEEHAHEGEDIGWDVTPPALNILNPVLGWTFHLVLVVTIPGTDTYVQVSTEWGILGWGQEDVTEAVGVLVDELRVSRDEMAARLAAPRN